MTSQTLKHSTEHLNRPLMLQRLWGHRQNYLLPYNSIYTSVADHRQFLTIIIAFIRYICNWWRNKKKMHFLFHVDNCFSLISWKFVFRSFHGTWVSQFVVFTDSFLLLYRMIRYNIYLFVIIYNIYFIIYGWGYTFFLVPTRNVWDLIYFRIRLK
jgi:hypothetical protein